MLCPGDAVCSQSILSEGWIYKTCFNMARSYDYVYCVYYVQKFLDHASEFGFGFNSLCRFTNCTQKVPFVSSPPPLCSVHGGATTLSVLVDVTIQKLGLFSYFQSNFEIDKLRCINE